MLHSLRVDALAHCLPLSLLRFLLLASNALHQVCSHATIFVLCCCPCFPHEPVCFLFPTSQVPCSTSNWPCPWEGPFTHAEHIGTLGEIATRAFRGRAAFGGRSQLGWKLTSWKGTSTSKSDAPPGAHADESTTVQTCYARCAYYNTAGCPYRLQIWNHGGEGGLYWIRRGGWDHTKHDEQKEKEAYRWPRRTWSLVTFLILSCKK